MTYRRKLLVEGPTEKRVIPYLMAKNGITWEIDNTPIVWIEASGGIDSLLQPGAISTELKASGVEALGLVVDANGNSSRRWTQIKMRCQDLFDDLPDDMPDNGLVCVDSNGIRFGVWIMPNNRFSGALEDFLIDLIPAESEDLYALAEHCVSEAAKSGAPFKTAHKSKAKIHTWLAWQDQPGKQLHHAVNNRVLDPEKPESRLFVGWFRSLFDL